jgi:hypothetical protein
VAVESLHQKLAAHRALFGRPWHRLSTKTWENPWNFQWAKVEKKHEKTIKNMKNTLW